jgi:hypothetical protein
LRHFERECVSLLAIGGHHLLGWRSLMATVQDIKRRLRSVGNTRKITKAMELVAAAKLRRAETRIEAMRPYAERMRELMIGTARATPSRQFPLLEEREDAQSVAIVPITGDRGLAGPFNTQVIRRSLALAQEARGAARRSSGPSSARRATPRFAFAAIGSRRPGRALRTSPRIPTPRRWRTVSPSSSPSARSTAW